MELTKFIQSFSNQYLDKFFILISKLGTETLGIIIALIFLWCFNKKRGYKLFFALCSSLLINNIVKVLVNSKRPIGEDGIRSLDTKHTSGPSFPSGHAQSTSTLFTYLSLELKKHWILIISILMIILTSLSRLYLGVHWPVDVVCGSILGIALMFFSQYIFNKYIENCNLTFIIIVVSLLLASLTLFPNEDYIKIIGAFTGLLIGYFIENNFIKFNPKSPTKLKTTLKLIIGTLGYALIYIISKKFVPQNNIRHFFTYFSLISWAIIIAPIIFLKLKLCNSSK